MSHDPPRVFKSPSGQSEVTVNGIGFDEAVDFMMANGWRELPVATEAKAAWDGDWQAACLESQAREKQERSLRAEAEKREAATKALLTESRWFVVDYAGISHNPNNAKCAKELAGRIDAVIFSPVAAPSGEAKQ
jgi:type II secretory pathway component HofQ